MTTMVERLLTMVPCRSFEFAMEALFPGVFSERLTVFSLKL